MGGPVPRAHSQVDLLSYQHRSLLQQLKSSRGEVAQCVV